MHGSLRKVKVDHDVKQVGGGWGIWGRQAVCTTVGVSALCGEEGSGLHDFDASTKKGSLKTSVLSIYHILTVAISVILKPVYGCKEYHSRQPP